MRRINLFSGPGGGKSTTAWKLAAALREHGISVELIHEVVKDDAYEGRPIEGAYQMKRFGEQAYLEENRLKNGVPHVVTDSPLPLQAYYARSRGESFWEALLEMSLYMEWMYPSINIFLDRTGLKYDPAGRFQTEAEALEVDFQMSKFLKDMEIPFKVIETRNFEAIKNHVLGIIAHDMLPKAEVSWPNIRLFFEKIKLPSWKAKRS